MTPKVKFQNKDSSRALTDKEVSEKIDKGAKVHNTALRIYNEKKRLRKSKKETDKRNKEFKSSSGARRGHPTSATFDSHAAIEISDPSLDRSCETAVAINAVNQKNIVAGAVTFDGTQFNNSAYVSLDKGTTWQTITALEDADEGAGIAFDDYGNCYYVSMHGGFNPCCVISQDGGLTWSAPAMFGYGDKTAVSARGQIALCGFDRINTEACAFTLDGGANWTVHDFTDSGLGTAPLVSYDLQYFYIIYGALDGNIKIYVSADQGQTWTGPNIVVPGNSAFSTIAGPLSYQGDSLTCPGTNVAIDQSGTLHVLYIDSSSHVPMYTSSSDHGTTWSAPVNVNPDRASDVHMFPCLSCDEEGNLLAGSLVYDQTLDKYSILRHVKTLADSSWKTYETDNAPWSAAPAPSGFRIGFGDYFDCDSFPECGISAMAWSETPNGQEPWQTWCRELPAMCPEVVTCSPCLNPEECCVSPCDPPWISDKQCLDWYEDRYFRVPIVGQRQGVEVANLASVAALRSYIEFRITYEHKLCLLGKQHGPLLFTTTLLPGETLKLYHSERYRRITSEQQRFSVQSTFMQFLSVVHQARLSNTLDALNETLSKTSASSESGGGGGFFFGFGLVGGSGGESSSSTVTNHTKLSVQMASDVFDRSVRQASQLTQIERSLVVSAYEEQDKRDVTVRTIHNANDCRAVTYFVRKIMELYSMSTLVSDINYRILAPNVPSDWHAIDDLGWLPAVIQDEIKNVLGLLPKIGQVIVRPRPISVPTDGTVYDVELAHCCSCEPERAAAIEIHLEKERLEARLAELEAKRRQLLLQKGDLGPFEPVPASSTPAP